MLILAAFLALAPTVAAHGCQEAAGTTDYCGACTEGEYHSHTFGDGTSCYEPPPCSTPGCNTIEALCKDFPVVCLILEAVIEDARQAQEQI